MIAVIKGKAKNVASRINALVGPNRSGCLDWGVNPIYAIPVFWELLDWHSLPSPASTAKLVNIEKY